MIEETKRKYTYNDTLKRQEARKVIGDTWFKYSTKFNELKRLKKQDAIINSRSVHPSLFPSQQ